jgi:mRNA interferase RelE/StbE
MAYEIKWTAIASKQFGRLDKTVQKRITDKIESIRDNPFFYATKLVGFDAYKIRVGDHRIILGIEKNTLVILVLKVGHRKSIYKDK